MKSLRKYHLILGCIFAPLLILFSATGIFQSLGLQHKLKIHNDYKVIKPWYLDIIRKLSFAHTPSRRSLVLNVDKLKKEAEIKVDLNNRDQPYNAKTGYIIFMILMAVGIISMTIMGVLLAFKTHKKKWQVILFLLIGIVIPYLLFRL